MRQRVPLNRRSDHINALALSNRLSIHLVVDALKGSLEEWGRQSSAVRMTVPTVAMRLFDRRGVEIIQPYLLSRDLSDFETLTNQPKREIIEKLVEAGINNIDSMTAEGLGIE